MSEHGSSRRNDPSKKDKGKSPALSKNPVSKSPVTGTVTPFGPLVPHPSYPGISVPVSPSSKLQVLGQIPKPYSSVLASQPREIDPFCASSKPISQIPSSSKRSDYVLNFQNILFHIEPYMKPKNNPSQLAASYFQKGWHFSPSAPYKTLTYYKDILISTDSIHIKPIYDKNDSTKIIFHSLYIKQILSEEDWINSQLALSGQLSDIRVIFTGQESSFGNYFCYFDYKDAWYKIFLHQNSSFGHSWFVQFDHKFKSQIPFWFSKWWYMFGPRSQIFPSILMDQVTYFSHRAKPIQHPLIPLLLHFVSKYKIPWILRWQYSLFSPVNDSSTSPSTGTPPVNFMTSSTIPAVSRDVYVKWWDKFNVQRIISQVQSEFPPVIPPVPTKESKTLKSSSASLHLSDIKEFSASELKVLLDAVKERRNELSKNASEDSSPASSEPSVNQDPLDHDDPFQDSQDPYA